jgi:hypothetical protein
VRKCWLAALALSFLSLASVLAILRSTPGWIRTPSGCAAWNFHPISNETISWSGGCVDGKLSGRGLLISYENGKEHSRYKGEMREGKSHGRGIGTDAEGARYEGDWRDGKIHGRGILTWANGSRYEGEFRNDKIHGRGILIEVDKNGKKTTFKGQFINNEPYSGIITGPDNKARGWRDGKWIE